MGFVFTVPALADAVQIRFFAATSIVVFALRFLSLDTFVGYASYTLFVLIAGQIHSSAYFYILFLAYIFLKPLQKAMRWMWPFILVGSFFLKKFIVSLTLIFASSRQSTYIYNPPREYASTFPAYASMLVIFYFVSKAINDEVIIRNNITEKEKQFSKLFYCICIISFVLLPPLIEMEWDFSRLLRPMWFLLYIDGIIAARNNLEIRLGPVKVKNIKLGIVCLSLIFGFLLDLCHFSASVLQAFFFYK
nr:EpsG family protein [Liquorilactobacillus satsumensis]